MGKILSCGGQLGCKQGGITPKVKEFHISFPIFFSKVLTISLTQFWDSSDEKYCPRIMSFDSISFNGVWGDSWTRGDGNKRCLWFAVGV